MRNYREASPPDPGHPVAAPTACPACRARDVMTTSKTVSAESYWRCVSCGEVWNVARREPNRTHGQFNR
jgi:transposase-like protein